MTEPTKSQRLSKWLMNRTNIMLQDRLAAQHIVDQEKALALARDALKVLQSALDVDRHDWEDWPVSSRLAIQAQIKVLSEIEKVLK